jgi:hypothetical protein
VDGVIWSRLPVPSADFAPLVAHTLRTAASAILSGAAVSAVSSEPSGRHENGSLLVALSGDAITGLVDDAEGIIRMATRCSKFITSEVGPSSPSFASNLTTSSSCVAAAICSSIRDEIRRGSSFAFDLTIRSGWTDVGGSPDTKRYGALGDAVTVSVAEWLGRRILTA